MSLPTAIRCSYWCCFRCGPGSGIKYGPGYAFAFSDFDGRDAVKAVGDESELCNLEECSAVKL